MLNSTIKTFTVSAVAAIAIAAPVSLVASQVAQAGEVTQASAKTAHSPLIRKKKKLKGDVSILEIDGRTVIRLSDDFRASNGPDLKIFLSPTDISTVNGKTATNGSVLVAPLKSTKGGQDYVVPEGVNLSDFASVLVHCEAFSVLWGGAAI